jgi:molybdenum cofactor biosynthesis enzyme MoaA
VADNRVLATLGYMFAKLTPNTNKLKKYRNLLIAAHSLNQASAKTENNPILIRVAPISICNYRCLFCEIHKDNVMYPNRPCNAIDMNDVNNFESFLSTAKNLELYGGSAEPLLNPDLKKILAYLKSKYGTRMMVNTNASVLTKEYADLFVKYGFDYILVSYHAGTKDKYHELSTTGDIDNVNNNLQYLAERKLEAGKKKPFIEFNFALQKENATEATAVIDTAKRLNVSAVLINKYYGGRNKLQDKMVSYDYDTKQGNEELDKIYQYADKLGVHLKPTTPSHWAEKNEKPDWNNENYKKNSTCPFPWLNLFFDPVLDEKDSFYVSVCNRIVLCKINYRKLKLSKRADFMTLWNHPVFQYLRSTVNKEPLNPICKYCKNCDREKMRNTDANEYAKIRDNAVKSFFAEYRRNHSPAPVDGLEILDDNPFSDEKYLDKLNSQTTL